MFSLFFRGMGVGVVIGQRIIRMVASLTKKAYAVLLRCIYWSGRWVS